MTEGLRYAANVSMLYAAIPLHRRFLAAAADGYTSVESWWPFASSIPSALEVDDFCHALDAAGVDLVALNLDTGDPARGHRGLLSDPAHEERVAENVKIAAEILERTGCRVLNVLYGNRDDAYTPAEQDRVACRRLVAIADRVAPLGVNVVLETLNRTDSPAFPLTDVDVSARTVARLREESAAGNTGLLLDTYHLAMSGTDPVAAVCRHAALIKHVQFADAPGRGRPGTGEIDFGAVAAALTEIGYAGHIGLEYDPTFTRGPSPRSREAIA